MKGGDVVSGGGGGDKRAEGVGKGRDFWLRGQEKVWGMLGSVGMCGVLGVWGKW